MDIRIAGQELIGQCAFCDGQIEPLHRVAVDGHEVKHEWCALKEHVAFQRGLWIGAHNAYIDARENVRAHECKDMMLEVLQRRAHEAFANGAA